MNLKYTIRLSKVEIEYFRASVDENFVSAFEKDKLLKTIVSVAQEDYNRAATIAHIPFKPLSVNHLLIFLDTGDPYVDKYVTNE